MAVVAIPWLGADFLRIVGFRNVLVAVQGHHDGMAKRDAVRAERNGLCNIRSVADASGIDEADLAALSKVVDCLSGLANGGHSRHAGILCCKMRPCTGAAFHPVYVDRVRIALDRHPDVVIDPRRAKLELDRDLPIGGFPNLLDFQCQIVRPEPVRMTRR